MKLSRVMIAAPKSGSGKTMAVCALLQILKDRGQPAVSCKCGPDYIDPMFHEAVIQVPTRNLDTFFTGEEQTKELLAEDRKEGDIAILEGVMGLFDGLGGIREEGSSYHLAKVTDTPIVLLVDAKGMGRSVIPLIAGFLAYDDRYLIQGVILNRISKSWYEILKPLAEEELGIKMLGYLPEQKELHMESRHLGLVMPHEISSVQKQLRILSGRFAETVCVEEILHIAGDARTLQVRGRIEKSPPHETVTIGVARDEAFCFYYEDNLRMLRECGARIRYFSPIHDEEIPEGCDGLLLGGGYPELYAKELGSNISMCRAVKKAICKGMPVVAECGGFMYLHFSITDQEGNHHDMAGVIPGSCTFTGKLVRFGYIELKEKTSRFLDNNGTIKGHEFHYYDSTNNGADCFAIKPVTNKTYSCIIEGENYWLGFPHLYYPSNPTFPERFVEMAQKYKERGMLNESGNKNCSNWNHCGR